MLRKSVGAVGALVMWVVLAMLVSPAWGARGDGERVGENLGDLLGGWAKSLYMGIAALVALVFLLHRRFADLAVFIVAAVCVGGFVMAPEQVAGTVRDIWHTLTGRGA